MFHQRNSIYQQKNIYIGPGVYNNTIRRQKGRKKLKPKCHKNDKYPQRKYF